MNLPGWEGKLPSGMGSPALIIFTGFSLLCWKISGCISNPVSNLQVENVVKWCQTSSWWSKMAVFFTQQIKGTRILFTGAGHLSYEEEMGVDDLEKANSFVRKNILYQYAWQMKSKKAAVAAKVLFELHETLRETFFNSSTLFEIEGFKTCLQNCFFLMKPLDVIAHQSRNFSVIFFLPQETWHRLFECLMCDSSTMWHHIHKFSVSQGPNKCSRTLINIVDSNF